MNLLFSILSFTPEVAALKKSVFRKVSAMDSIFDSVDSVLGSEGVGPELFSDFGVVRATELPELVDHVFSLLHDQNHTRARDEVFAHVDLVV